uniref:4Fe-4S dicluster domain-containing protein n=1 Tax=Ignisphaera aggregans TaxID=334771 RepID=A0A7J3JPE9_9CREN
MPRRIIWPKVKKIYWCLNCNIPLLQQDCPICGSECRRIPLSDPGDARIAFERDLQGIRTGYLYEFGTDKGFDILMGRSVTLLNKAPYFDEMKEVYVDGLQIGRFYFDPFLRRWRFRVSKVGAMRILSVDPEIIEKVVVDKKRCYPMDMIRVDRDVDPYKQVLLVRQLGDVVGLGYSIGGGKIVVYSWWGEDTAISEDNIKLSTRSSIEDVMRAHEEYMNMVESRAKKFISITHEKVSMPLIASFSGGKDSLVSLHLALSLGLEPRILFNNTGIELPETVETVHRIADKYSLELIEASANDIFWKAVYSLGVPGRDYRWCCKTCKLTPLHRISSRLWKSGALNIVGQRALESIDRARSPKIWRLRWAPQLLNISPINEWSQLEVWLYIFRHKLSPNPLYFTGFERIGCFMCPASTLAELELVSKTHPDLWSRWLNVLLYWANRLDVPREWIDYGLWRWNAPARYRTMIAKRLNIVNRVDNWRRTFAKMVPIEILDVQRDDSHIEIAFKEPIDLAFLVHQIHIIHPKKYSINEEGSANIYWDSCSLYISSNRIVLRYHTESDVEKLIDVLKLLFRWHLCTGCRSCEANCISGAFKVVEGENGVYKPMVLDKTKCLGCRFCMYNCPVTDVYVEHIVVPLIFDNYEAWRRKTREHHNDILEKMKKVVMLNSGSGLKLREYGKRSSLDEYIDVSQFFKT